MSWICKRCETENPDTVDVCEVCDAQVPVLSDFGYEIDLIDNIVTFSWNCEHCDEIVFEYESHKIDVTRKREIRLNIKECPQEATVFSVYGINDAFSKRLETSLYLKDFLQSLCGLHRKEKNSLEGLKSVLLSDSIKALGEGAFENCHLLQKIFIPASMTKIGWRTFCG